MIKREREAMDSAISIGRVSIGSLLLFVICFVGMTHTAEAADITAEHREFFEARIRPILVEHCYACHNSRDTAEADLALDSRSATRKATANGVAVVPGNVDESLLLRVIRHEVDGLEMPQDGPQLSDTVIADFEKWIRMGAPDPREQPPSESELADATSWDAKFEKRKQWWCFQPIKQVSVPNIDQVHPIDRFVEAKLRESGLPASPAAGPRTLLRRLSFTLTGLPPSPEQLKDFEMDPSSGAFEQAVDELLASDRFGERWARHWMDWVRYADSHGSEGDPTIPHAYRYRDYLIRALNQDVPYDQLLKEHVAGDLLAEPRINHELGINESAIGPAHWRMVFHGFAPTDALDEKVRFTDDQINVFSKAFLALTVSCARCHDHKFDAISQEDYYALFGVLGSCRPALIDANAPDVQATNKQQLTEVKESLKGELSDYWLSHVEEAVARVTKDSDADQENPSPLQAFISECLEDEAAIPDVWMRWRNRWQEETRAIEKDKQDTRYWDLTDPTQAQEWFSYGNGMVGDVIPAGEFTIDVSDGEGRVRILPAGIHSNLLSTKHAAMFASPRIFLDGEYDVWLWIRGGGNATVRYAVQNYPRSGTVYPISEVNHDDWRWKRFSVKYWEGDDIHLELATARDAPLQVRNSDRSWFGMRAAALRPAGSEAPRSSEVSSLSPLLDSDQVPQDAAQFKRQLRRALKHCLQAWKTGEMADGDAIFLNAFVQRQGFPKSYPSSIQDLFERYRELESQIPLPTRVPGLAEADAFDQPLFERGNHRKPLEPVSRRFLSALDPELYQTKQSGRLDLANDLVDPRNPLTARVIVNRLWHYTYGQGLVRTPDNFGRLGETPSHPELLDYLAQRFVEDDWSIKRMLRFLVTSESWKRSSRPGELAMKVDPENRLLSHANVRRLDAEAIRDSLLQVSRMMDTTMYGTTVGANSDSTRRSIYVSCRRNSLDRFLTTFDAPVPFATKGRRDVTNVPAQSLTMMNSGFVQNVTRRWAGEVSAAAKPDNTKSLISDMFENAIGRKPEPAEVDALANYLDSLKSRSLESVEIIRQVGESLDRAHQELETILEPARQAVHKRVDSDPSVAVMPMAAWDFEDGLRDQIGELHGLAKGKAHVKDGALVLDGGYVVTASLKKDLAAKTFDVLVQLDDLDQQGGAAISVQDDRGVVFDALVFGEQAKGHWLAGSDNFSRTEPFSGAAEDQADSLPVHVAITYAEDGTIRGYRNGEPYGRAYRTELERFASGKTEVLFGLRHGTPAPSRLLRGKILAARLFDRALTEDEVRSLADGAAIVREPDVLAELTQDERVLVERLKRRIEELESRREELGEPPSDQDAWQRVAHSLVNLKEFIYVD